MMGQLGLSDDQIKVCMIDGDINMDGVKYTLVVVYCPHGGYPGRDVEKVYEILSQERKHALQKGN